MNFYFFTNSQSFKHSIRRGRKQRDLKMKCVCVHTYHLEVWKSGGFVCTNSRWQPTPGQSSSSSSGQVENLPSFNKHTSSSWGVSICDLTIPSHTSHPSVQVDNIVSKFRTLFITGPSFRLQLSVWVCFRLHILVTMLQTVWDIIQLFRFGLSITKLKNLELLW